MILKQTQKHNCKSDRTECVLSVNHNNGLHSAVYHVFFLFKHGDVFRVVLNRNQLKSVLLILESCKDTSPYLVLTETPLCSFITRHYNSWWLGSVPLNSKDDTAFATKTKPQTLASSTLSLPRFLSFLIFWSHLAVTPLVKRYCWEERLPFLGQCFPLPPQTVMCTQFSPGW